MALSSGSLTTDSSTDCCTTAGNCLWSPIRTNRSIASFSLSWAVSRPIRCGSRICDDSSTMARVKCLSFNRLILAFKALVVPQNTLELLMSLFKPFPPSTFVEREDSRNSRYSSEQERSEPMRMKSKSGSSRFISTSLLQISSTALLVYESNSTFESGSVSSSLRRFTSPKDVFPVPGGPIIRKISRACLARVTSVLKRP